MPTSQITVLSIYGEQATAGTAEETVSLSVDGVTMTSIPVPEGELILSDVSFGAEPVMMKAIAALEPIIGDAALADPISMGHPLGLDPIPPKSIAIFWKFQVDRGDGFRDIANFIAGGPDLKSFTTAFVVEGGPGVLFRVRVETTFGPAVVNITLRAYREV